jgi:hypothetical protein
MVSGMSLRPLLLAATLLAWPLSSCVVVKIESPAGVRIKPELKRGMSYAAARAAVGRGGVITAETEHRFTAGRQPVLVRAIGTPAAPPDLSPLPAAERARVAKSVSLTRYYGILGLDEFTLLLDANDRLLSSDLYPVN